MVIKSNAFQHYSSYVLYRSWAMFRLESTRLHLGTLWWMLEPLMDMGVYYLIFGVLLNRGGPDFLPFLLVGLVFWRLFSEGLMSVASSISGSIELAREVSVPKIVFPFIQLMLKLYLFSFSLALLVIVLAIFGFYPNVHWLGAIPSFITLLLLMLGVALPLAAVVPFVPDLFKGVSHLLRMLFFMSGIFYDIESTSEAELLKLNPVVVIITSARKAFIRDESPLYFGLGIIAVCSIFGIILGVGLIRHFDRKYAKRVPA